MTITLKVSDKTKEQMIKYFEDLQKRAKVSSTLIEKMKSMGILDNLDESSQLSLF